jgi:protein-tyrosine-phosphatase
MERRYNVLFLCTGNSARSIMAEAMLRQMGAGRFEAYSAGSHPGGAVNPLVLEFLEAKGLSTVGARSKSWDEFATADAPSMDLIITVCDQAAGEACPVWPGMPARAHWSAPDPAIHMDDPVHAKRVIREVFQIMHRRISLLANLPVQKLDRISLQSAVREIAAGT